MPRLIDADALRERATNAKNYGPEMMVVGLGYVFSAPTIDPVKHGRWNEITLHNGCTPDYDCVCSECGASGGPYYNYCPECGARMDMKDDEEEG